LIQFNSEWDRRSETAREGQSHLRKIKRGLINADTLESFADYINSDKGHPMLSPEMTSLLVFTLTRMREEIAGHERTRDYPPPDEVPLIGPAAHTAQADDAPEGEMIADDEARLASHDDVTLGAIDRQLGRLELGEADICIECGEIIPPERLLANPTAVTCIRCQREDELRERRAHPGAQPSM
jgi:DnaK suppressor protein